MENEINNDDNIVKVDEDQEEINVLFIKSNRYYCIDSNENIKGPEEKLVDKYPGDITKNNTRTGENEEKAYIINCIEDLVEFSNMVNQGNNFTGKYIKLNRSLDFKSVSSYNNAFEKYRYDNQKGYVKDEESSASIKYLLNNGIGFIPIGKDDTNYFSGTFDGQKNEIENLFINNKDMENVGLFGYGRGIIQKLGMVSPKIIGEDTVGSICGKLKTSNGKIQYCYNINGDIEGAIAGGIVGKTCESNFSGGSSVVKNCYNTGKVIATSDAGGIAGQSRIWVIHYICV